jgi:NADH-quinone oxidoreductase subunit N
LKYLILGATASAVFIYGASLVYGSAGTTLFAALFRDPLSLLRSSPGLWVGGILVLSALAFKMAAVPFHMWAPDVYQGAPTPVTAYLSTASKAAGFAALMRVFFGPIGVADTAWTTIVATLAAMSMIVGNLLAIPQRDIKRMLAYSGIAQAGYGLVGIAAASALGTLATTFFLFQYLFTNIGVFLIVSMVESPRGADGASPDRGNEIRSYHGLSRRNPVLAFALLLLLLSLGGIPPLGGFWGKLFVFWAGIQRGQYGLVMIGVLASVVSLYYYLMVARALYIEPAEARPAIKIPVGAAVAVLVCVVLVIGLAYPAPILNRAHEASMALARALF